MNRKNGANVDRIAQTREQLHCFLRGARQSAQFGDHEIRHVIGETRGSYAIQIPAPGRLTRLQLQKVLFSEGGQKLNSKKRVATSLRVHELCQRLRARRLATQGITKQLVHVFKRE